MREERNTNNDLISRNALIQHAYSAVVDGAEKDIIDLSDVDNAPTVENITIFCENADEKTNDELKKELEKVMGRPQGEWYYSYLNGWHCSICHESVKDMPTVMGKAYFNFCPNCGAKMKGD